MGDVEAVKQLTLAVLEKAREFRKEDEKDINKIHDLSLSIGKINVHGRKFLKLAILNTASKMIDWLKLQEKNEFRSKDFQDLCNMSWIFFGQPSVTDDMVASEEAFRKLRDAFGPWLTRAEQKAYGISKRPFPMHGM